MTISLTRRMLGLTAMLAVGCGGEIINRAPQADSGFSTEGPDDAGAFDDDGVAEEGDDGEPDDPPESDLCDAGDEAWVKRVIPFIQGRRPDSIREVRVLVSAIQQLDSVGQDGRRLVARALANGDRYLERWKTYLYEDLRVQRSGDRLNALCYDRATPAAFDSTLATAIRDNAPTEQIGDPLNAPTITDLAYSSLHLDDVSPLYRADLFARMWAPLTGGNVTREELEVSNRSLFGGLFESVYLGRNTECLQCHITTQATTYRSEPDENRHWSVHPEVNVEMAVYGPFEWGQETRELQDVHAIFRHSGVVDYSWCTAEAGGCNPAVIGTTPGATVWGMSPTCGIFRNDNFEDPDVDIDAEPYMAGSFGQGRNASLFELEERLHDGFDALAESGLTATPGEDFMEPDDAEAAMAFLFSLNFAEGIWTEAMGFPLTVANKFPRNEAQRDTLQHMAETFYSSHYSLRELIVEVATHEYFSQAPPESCGQQAVYGMPAVFDPFTKEAEDPAERGNGVGDMVHRYSAAVLFDSAAQALWWTRFDRFPTQTTAAFLAAFLDPALAQLGVAGNITQIDPTTTANLGCCGAGFCDPCYDEPNNTPLLRDVGLHINQFEAGFSGTDFNGLLHWESEYAGGDDPGLGDPATSCTGPLGGECATSDYVSRLVSAAGSATMRDIAVALKDRLITEPAITSDAEVAAIEAIMGETLDTPVASASDAQASARRYVGVLLNTPQFMLDGIVSANQPIDADPVVVVSGTETERSCTYFADLTSQTPEWSGLTVICNAEGISVN